MKPYAHFLLYLTLAAASTAAEPVPAAADVLRQLAEQAPPPQCGENELTRWGAQQERLRFLSELLTKGNVELKYLPLLECVLENSEGEGRRAALLGMVRRLLELGVNPNGAEDNGEPLLLAAHTGATEVCRMLLDAGARTDVKDFNGHSPLYLAVAHHRTECVALLLERMGKKALADKGASLIVAIDDPEPEDCSCGSSGPSEAEVLPVCRLLVRAGVRVNGVRGENQRSLLHILTFSHMEEDPVQLCRFLIENGADVNAKDQGGDTPLDTAVRYGREKLCRELQAAGARCSKVSPLQLAILLGQVEEVRRLLREGAVAKSCVTYYGKEEPVLLYAVRHQQKEIVSLLLESGVRQEAEKAFVYASEELAELLLPYVDAKKPALMRYAVMSGYMRLCRQMLERGADAAAERLLAEAAARGDAEMCRLLLERGAGVNGVQSGICAPPICAAAAAGHEHICRLLLEAGASPNGAAHQSVTAFNPLTKQTELEYIMDRPMRHALEGGYIGICNLLRHAGAYVGPKLSPAEKAELMQAALSGRGVESVRWLLAAGVPAATAQTWLNQQTSPSYETMNPTKVAICQLLIKEGVRPAVGSVLHIAVNSGDVAWCRRLIADGADVNAANDHGFTPLALALHCKHAEMVQLLLQAGAKMGSKDTTPDYAVKHGTPDICRLMLATGAVSEEDKIAALFEAIELNNEVCTFLLLQAGVNPNVSFHAFKTPLHIAAESDVYMVSPLICRILLAAGADPNARDSKGYTPSHLAQMNKYMLPEVKKIFRSIAPR